MRKSVNLLTNENPATLSRDLDAIAQGRAQRDMTTDFASYLDFLEEAAAAFGFDGSKNNKDMETTDPAPLL